MYENAFDAGVFIEVIEPRIRLTKVGNCLPEEKVTTAYSCVIMLRR